MRALAAFLVRGSKYSRLWASTFSRKRTLPGWELMRPPRPERTSWGWGVRTGPVWPGGTDGLGGTLGLSEAWAASSAEEVVWGGLPVDMASVLMAAPKGSIVCYCSSLVAGGILAFLLGCTDYEAEVHRCIQGELQIEQGGGSSLLRATPLNNGRPAEHSGRSFDGGEGNKDPSWVASWASNRCKSSPLCDESEVWSEPRGLNLD